jgi:hypothetical protein
MKIRQVGAESLHAEIETDGQTDMTRPIVAFHNFLGVLKKVAFICELPTHISPRDFAFK